MCLFSFMCRNCTKHIISSSKQYVGLFSLGTVIIAAILAKISDVTADSGILNVCKNWPMVALSVSQCDSRKRPLMCCIFRTKTKLALFCAHVCRFQQKVIMIFTIKKRKYEMNAKINFVQLAQLFC